MRKRSINRTPEQNLKARFTGVKAYVTPLAWGILRELADKPDTPITYYCKAGPFVKIGRTQNFGERLHNLRTALPYEVEVVRLVRGFDEEARAHARFEPLRVRGEWFRFEGDLAEFMADPE